MDMTISTLKKIQQYTLFFISFIILSGCAAQNEVPLGQVESAWDFDHKVQFYKTKLDENHYRLEVVTSNKANFQRLSAFLLRKSYLICGGYGYTLTPIKGVESFDYKRASPHLIRANLVAKIECPIS